MSGGCFGVAKLILLAILCLVSIVIRLGQILIFFVVGKGEGRTLNPPFELGPIG